MRSLKRVQPHVLLIAYGSNVAFADDEGFAAFRSRLDKLLAAVQPTGVPVVLLSPPPQKIEFEIAGNFSEQNRRLQRVASHLKRTASQRNVEFVDLFSLWPMRQQAEQLTDDGMQLNDGGYRQWAKLITGRLFSDKGAPWTIHLSA